MSTRATPLYSEFIDEYLEFVDEMEADNWFFFPDTKMWVKQTDEGTNVKADWQAYRDWKVQREGVIGGG